MYIVICCKPLPTQNSVQWCTIVATVMFCFVNNTVAGVLHQFSGLMILHSSFPLLNRIPWPVKLGTHLNLIRFITPTEQLGVTSCENGNRGKNKVPRAGQELIIYQRTFFFWQRIVIEVPIRTSTESNHPASTVIVGVNTFRQLLFDGGQSKQFLHWPSQCFEFCAK